MSELGDATASVRRTASRVKSVVGNALAKLAVVTVLTGWVLFWSTLVRLHYIQTDYMAAVFTTLMLVGPGLAVLAWYVGETLGFDIPTPTGDGTIIST